MKRLILVFCICSAFYGATVKASDQSLKSNSHTKSNLLSNSRSKLKSDDSAKSQVSTKFKVPANLVIAHRGASYDAPEETSVAYTIARDWGADYLEADIQRTKDGVLICLHDNNLVRTTDVVAKFPDRADKPVSEFTLAELKTLDAGTWFNTKYPSRAKPEYVGAKIVTLDELITISESGENHPGLYLETKEATMFPGIEKDIAKLLRKRNWLEAGPQSSSKGTVDRVGLGASRLIMQTFVPDSLKLIHQEMPNVPLTFLLWLDGGTLRSTTPDAKPAKGESFAQYSARLKVAPAEFDKWLTFAKESGATGIGPSMSTQAKGDQSYMDLAEKWMNEKAHKKGLFVHVYTVDEVVDMKRMKDQGVDGFFTNRADVAINFFKRNVGNARR